MKVASLVPSFLAADAKLHAARYIKAGALGYCGITSTADEPIGVYHVPNWAFDGRAKHGDVAVCISCSAVMCALAEPP